MILEEFDINVHNHYKLAELVFYVDKRTYLKVFSSKEIAISSIEKIILAENSNLKNQQSIIFSSGNSNNFSKTEKIYVLVDENSRDKDILGFVNIVKGKKRNIFEKIAFLFRKLSILNAIRLSLIELLDSMVLSKIEKDDYYVAELAINESHRGKGLGTFILNKIIHLAKEEGFKRVTLDVDLTNLRALKLYESLGFKKFDKKSIKILNKERGMFNMEYYL